MASREEIERLRQLARQRHRAATQKASRLRAKGVDITGTKHDPRRDLANLKKYNTKQLQAYIGQLNNFTSRETSWVHGAGKKALLTGQLYNRFERLKNQFNAKNAATFEKPIKGPKNNPHTGTPLKDIRLPSFGQTETGEYASVEQRIDKKPKHPVTQSPSSRAPHLPILTTAAGIPNDKQLKKLIKDLEKKLGPDYGDKVIARDQKVMRKFFRDMRKVNPSDELKKLREDFWNLTPGQFAFLWNYTDFADAASTDYEIAKSHMHDKKGLGTQSETFNTQIRYMQSIVNDVKPLPFK